MTPDVSLVADPATGAWVSEPYNLNPTNPFEVVGGTSLSAPAWAGLFALINQGRVAADESTLNSVTPTDAQQALYMLPQSAYNVISSGNNGYSAAAGYNLVTGLGTPVANVLVPDLIAYQGPGTTYSGATVAAMQSSGLVNTGSSGSSPMDVFSAFDALTTKSAVAGRTQPRPSVVSEPNHAPARAVQAAPKVPISVVDQVLGVLQDDSSHQIFIGDLAFEQVSSGTHQPKGSVVTETTR
jgi:hypothetical protein